MLHLKFKGSIGGLIEECILGTNSRVHASHIHLQLLHRETLTPPPKQPMSYVVTDFSSRPKVWVV